HELVSSIPIAPNQTLRRNYSLSAIRAQGAVSAIMQQNYIAAAHLTGDFCFDYIGGRRIPVVAGDIPHHGAQAKFARNPQSRGTPSSKWWTKEVRMRSDCVF